MVFLRVYFSLISLEFICDVLYVEDMNRIIDLSVNIPNVAKPLLKKNAINEIYTEDIKTRIYISFILIFSYF
jgi:hypothetical protein